MLFLLLNVASASYFYLSDTMSDLVPEGQCYQSDSSCTVAGFDITQGAIDALGAGSGQCPSSFATNCESSDEVTPMTGCSLSFQIYATSTEACPSMETDFTELPTDSLPTDMEMPADMEGMPVFETDDV